MPLKIALLFFLLLSISSSVVNAQDKKESHADLLLKHNKRWKTSRIKHGEQVIVKLDEHYHKLTISGILTHAQDSIIFIDTIGFHLKHVTAIKGKSEHALKNGKEEVSIGLSYMAVLGGLTYLIIADTDPLITLTAAAFYIPVLVGGVFYLVRGLRELSYNKIYVLSEKRWRIEINDTRKRPEKRAKPTKLIVPNGTDDMVNKDNK
ncbi:MAG: hypothetical protein ACXITV_06235 [Luteibaculaceae bacterium]